MCKYFVLLFVDRPTNGSNFSRPVESESDGASQVACPSGDCLHQTNILGQCVVSVCILLNHTHGLS